MVYINGLKLMKGTTWLWAMETVQEISVHGQMVCANTCMALMTSESENQISNFYQPIKTTVKEHTHTTIYATQSNQNVTGITIYRSVQYNQSGLTLSSCIYIDGVGVVVPELWTQCVDYC